MLGLLLAFLQTVMLLKVDDLGYLFVSFPANLKAHFLFVRTLHIRISVNRTEGSVYCLVYI